MLLKIKCNSAAFTKTHFIIREMASKAKCLKFAQYGEPADVLKLHEVDVPEPKSDEVLVRVLAAPINPSDINTIQGKYPVKPKLPAIGGNEFVADVIKVGECVENLKPGDRVVPNMYGIGTWISQAVYPSSQLLKVPCDMDIAQAATITVNPCTAYRMLKDFVKLVPRTTIIQNGANSSVGQAVHQLCRAWGICSVGVVRNRPEVEGLKKYLKCLGATEILTDEELNKTEIFKSKKLKKPILALNCIGGKSSADIARHLQPNSTVVTYGGMSREPVTVGTGALIFKNISYVGYWMTRWAEKYGDTKDKTKMYCDLFALIEAGRFQAPAFEMVPLSNFKEAVKVTLEPRGYAGKKLILDFK